ncbi:histone H1-like [Nerophis ophidion]|uniref:histone H1-like n=1 Tax=Nerophis ophidion TaxID=159077 RepID=UPI002ADFF861|nr:histone H1-like [Nerophis ophidion]
MAEEAPAAAAGPSKAQAKPAKKRTAASKAKKTSPNIADAIMKAMKNSGDRKGTSMTSIKKAVAALGVDLEKSNKRVNTTLCRLVATGELIQVKGAGASGSFKLPKAAEPKAKGAKKVAKRSAVKKTAAKKSTVTKKAAAKPRKATSPKKKAKAPAKSPKKAAKKAPAKKSPAKKPAAKKAPAKRAAPKKTPTKRTAPKKTGARKTKK